MTDRGLRAYMEDLADDVPSPDLAGLAWREAARRRARRRTTAAALAAAAVVGVLLFGFAASPAPDTGQHPSGAASASTTRVAGLTVDVAPAPEREGDLPPMHTALPDPATLDPKRALRLSTSPVTRALALFQFSEDPRGVYVLGDDGRMRLLDTVALTEPADASGNRQSVVDGTSRSDDGSRAAFAQPDAVVVVDLTTGDAESIALPGHNENVVWRMDGRELAVEQEDATFLLDVDSRTPRRQPYRGFDAVAVSGGSSSTVLRFGAADGGGPVLSEWTTAGTRVRTAQVPLSGIANDDWWGPGWGNGDLVARTAFAAPDLLSSGGDVVVAVDVQSSRPVRALLLDWDRGTDRQLGCCPVAGWSASGVVLVRSAGRLLAWHPRTGSLRLAGRLPHGVDAAAFSGLAWRT